MPFSVGRKEKHHIIQMVLESAVLGNGFESPHLGACQLEKQRSRERAVQYDLESPIVFNVLFTSPAYFVSSVVDRMQRGVTTWTL